MAAGSILATGVALAVAYFPMLFNQWVSRDDEGVFVFALREFVTGHGHLYSTIWSDLYGPFYYFFMSTIYRVIQQQPSLENGRWIVLILTTASAGLFAASVWRVTKSLPCTILCEVATFLILIEVAGNEPMHPGSLGVFLVAVVAFAMSSFAVSRQTAHLVVVGAATGALLMTKVNSGGLVAAAVVFGVVIGSRKTPRWMQIAVGILTVLLPIVLVSQNISELWAAAFAFVVIISVVGVVVVASIDQLSLPSWPLLPIAQGATGAVVVSLAFPLLYGTPLTAELRGVFVRPLSLANTYTVPANIKVDWFTIVLAAAAVGAAVVFRSLPKESVRAHSGWTHAALAAIALWLLGLGANVYATGWVAAKWLPTLVLLPALAFCANSAEPVRLALRFLVILATLQVLVVYPVEGSQLGWGTVAMVVPCAIALSVGIDHSHLWRESGWLIRGGATAILCLALVFMFSTNNANTVWVADVWKGYLDNPELGLPGTGLIHVDPTVAANTQAVAQALRAQCDTFYGVPSQNSFYIFSGLPPVTGLLANGGPGGLTVDQQGKVVEALQEKTLANQRVCILRDTSQVIAPSSGPLTDALNQYAAVVTTLGSYTISRHS